MPAPKRVSDARILEALTRWRGNVTAASEELGIAPNNLRPRLRGLRVDLEGLRKGAAEARECPIKPAKTRCNTLRLSAALQDRIRGARWDLQARFRVELDDTAVLEAFLQEAFAGWLKAKLAEKGGE